MTGKTSTKSAKVAKKPAAKSSDPMSTSQRIDAKIAGLGDWRGDRFAQIRQLIQRTR